MKFTEAFKKSGTSAIIYSEPGVGKTHSVSTLSGKTLLIAAESNGIRTFANMKGKGDFLERLDIVFLPEAGRNPAETSARLNEFFSELMINTPDVDNIVLDSATELVSFMLLQKTDPEKNGGAPSQHAYLEVQTDMRRYMRIMRDLASIKGKNIIIIALESELVLQQNSNNEINSKLHPNLSGKKLAPEIEGLFDIVAHLEIKNDRRFFRLQSNDFCCCKDRFGRKFCDESLQNLVSGVELETKKPESKTETKTKAE